MARTVLPRRSMMKTPATKKAPSLAKRAMRKLDALGRSVEAKVDSVTDGLKRLVSVDSRQPAMTRVSRKLAPKR